MIPLFCWRLWVRILPNLRKIDLSISILGYSFRVLADFSERCANMEKVIWNNINQSSYIFINGLAMSYEFCYEPKRNLHGWCGIFQFIYSYILWVNIIDTDWDDHPDILFFQIPKQSYRTHFDLKCKKWVHYSKYVD